MKRCLVVRLRALVAFALSLSASFSLATAQPDPSPPSNPPEGAEPETPQPTKWYSASYSVVLTSRYLFQGLDYSDGKPVLQPEIDVSLGPLTAKCWANHDLNQGVSNEFDLSLEHGWTAGTVSGSVGYTHLHYPHRDGWDPSQEIYASIARAGWIHTSLSVHYDFDAGDGAYATLGLSHSVERPLGTITGGINLFHQASYYDASGIPAVELNVNMSRSLGRVSITPAVSRFITWENGDFRGPLAVQSAWTFSLGFAQEF